MTYSEFVRAFDALPLPPPSTPSSSSFCAIPVEPDNAHKLGKDEGGCPCLLVSTGPGAKGQTRVPLVLENLAVLFDLSCHVSAPSTVPQSGTFSVIKCVSADAAVRLHFLALLPGISAALGRTSDRAKIASVVDDIVELFRALSAIPKKEIQGLWGELLLIYRANDAVALAEAWHAESTDRYDFNQGAERIDAKTSSRAQRRHHFTLEQLTPPAGTRLIIASMFVQTSGAGAGVFDLLDAIRPRLGGNLQLHLRLTRLVHQTLGTAWQTARNIRFDVEAASQSLRFFEGSSIPRVATPLPEDVSEVRFVADLERIKSLVAEELGKVGLFGSL